MPQSDYIEDRITGKRGFIYYDTYASGNDPPETWISVTNWGARIRRHYQDTTNSTSYHPDQQIVYATRTPSAIDIEASIEGNFHINTTPFTFIADLFNGDNKPARIELSLDTDQRLFNGLWTISDFSIGIPIFGVVTYRATIRNFGAIEWGEFTRITQEEDPFAF